MSLNTNVILKQSMLNLNLGLNFIKRNVNEMANRYHEDVTMMFPCFFNYDKEHFYIDYIDKEHGVQHNEIGDWALSQLCSIFRIPKSYFNYCCETSMQEAMKDLLNAHAAHEFSDFKFLCYNDYVGGIVSPKYLRISHKSVIDTLYKALEKSNSIDDFKLVNYDISSDFLHLRIINSKPFFIDAQGSEMYAGMMIQNSEVGRSHLFVRLFIYRKVCSNGLMLPFMTTEYRRKHIGKYYCDEDINLSMQEIMEYMTNNDYYSNVRHCLEQSQRTYYSLDCISNRLEKMGFDDNLIDAILKYDITNNSLYTKRSEYSLYEVINGITFNAKFKPLERRVQLEEKASNLLQRELDMAGYSWEL